MVQRRKISKLTAEAIESVFGVPLSAYKAEQPKEEQLKCIVELPEINSQDTKEILKAILCLLREVCNNQVAMYKRINHLTGEVIRFREEYK